MSIGFTDTQNYSDIADAIRAKGGSGTFEPSQMAQAIINLPGGGGGGGTDGQFFPMNMLEHCLPTMTLTYGGNEI